MHGMTCVQRAEQFLYMDRDSDANKLEKHAKANENETGSFEKGPKGVELKRM
ncbi:BQ5605_C004g02887 [Microbotryum silenes-dioicae]|uniref:BQ5605_C004g02887 protein n=1 Tax=Microbotryum silenes-dioicae TaxID=796604 RepID=A0A2X0MD77_9BASI|nr:BQ5605_C004g02887 [Microbotryum silenes-dioicae]